MNIDNERGNDENNKGHIDHSDNKVTIKYAYSNDKDW